MDNDESFITDALSLPCPAILYETSRRVAARFPGRVVQTDTWSFDPADFADAGRCTLKPLEGVHAQTSASFRHAGRPLVEEIETGWVEVEWDGERLEVLRLSWRADGERSTVSWIVGATRAVAEAFTHAVCAWNAEVRADVEVLVFERGGFHKSAELHRAIRHASFDDLVLPPPLRAQLCTDFARFFEARPLYQRYGVAWRRGALFTGPPGNGKTHAIKALVNHLGKPCLYVRSFESACGDRQSSVRAVFSRARDAAPCVLVLEDLDALVDDGNRSFFLNELDGFAANEGIVTVATTNHPERLDPAIAQRPSRFDRRYAFEPPDAEGRAAYFALWGRALAAEMRPSDDRIPGLVEATAGLSYAYLKELVVSAMIRWMDDRKEGSMGAIMTAEAASLRAQVPRAH